MSRVLAALVMVVAVLGGRVVPLAVAAPRTRLTVPAALITGEGLESLAPFKGASRDRTLHGKARRLARRAA